MMQKTRKMTATLAHGYSSEGTQRELSNEYQHDRYWMVFKNLCIPVPLKGLICMCQIYQLPDGPIGVKWPEKESWSS